MTSVDGGEGLYFAYWSSVLYAWGCNYANIIWVYFEVFGDEGMISRYYSRGFIYGLSYKVCGTRIANRNGFIHCKRSNIFLFIFLGLFSQGISSGLWGVASCGTVSYTHLTLPTIYSV